MSDTQKCIYCLVEFDPARGEGDHVIPAAFGDFDGDVPFRGICVECNRNLGAIDAHLLRCGPEAAARLAVHADAPRRRRRAKGSVGANGARPPLVLVRKGDHTEVAQQLPGRSPGDYDASFLEQLVGLDAAGVEQHVFLFPGMTARALRRRLEEQGLGSPARVWFNCDDNNRTHYLDLVREIWPGCHVEDLPALEPGVHPAPVTVKFEVTEHYWRAIAKIAFHYSLLHGARGFLGHEPQFAAVREFIMHGGDPAPFFGGPGPTFRPDAALRPSEWGHVLSATESSGVVRAFVHLFRGPASPTRPYLVTLARIARTITVPGGVVGHVYRYDPVPSTKGCAGRVESLRITNRIVLIPI